MCTIQRKVIFFICILYALTCNGQHTIINNSYNIKINQSVKLSFSSNPSTGFIWQCKNKDKLKHVVLMQQNYLSSSNKKRAVGVGGTEHWLFKGKKTGCDTLIFQYARPWQGGEQAEIKKIIINVK